MTRSSSLAVLAAIAAVASACRPAEQTHEAAAVPTVPKPSTGVGNPGDMTISMGRTTGLSIGSVGMAVDSIVVEGCGGGSTDVELDDSWVGLDSATRLPISRAGWALLSDGICAVELVPGGPLVAVGEVDSGGGVEVLVEPASVRVALDSPVFIDREARPLLELVVGADGWLDADWLGAEPDSTVRVDADHPQYRTVVERLGVVELRVEGEAEPAGRQEGEGGLADLHVAVGPGGRVALSYDGGATWPVDTATSLPGEGDDLSGLAIAADHSGGARMVAVGGSGTGRAVVSFDGKELVWKDIASETLVDVAWTGDNFVAIGKNGTVVRSPDGETWEVDPALEDCTFEAIDANGADVVAVGAHNLGGGCAYHSETHGRSWALSMDLPSTTRAVHGGGTWVAVGDGGKVSWSLDAGASWNTVVLADDYLHDVVRRDGWVKVLGDHSVHATTDFVDLYEFDTAGFIRWSSDIDDGGLIAMTEDGDIYATPEDDLDLVDWEFRGTVGRGESGFAITQLAWWPR